MLQYLVVSAIVVVAVTYVAWSLAPRTLRLRLANRALAWARSSTGCPGWLRERITHTASKLALSACETCGSGSGRKRANADVARKNPH